MYVNKTGGWSKFCATVKFKHGMKQLSMSLKHKETYNDVVISKQLFL